MSAWRGTVGYIAPEVIRRNIGGVSHKSDVYSYGMLLFDMVGVKDNIYNRESQSGEIMYFPDWIYRRLKEPREIYRLHGGITEEEEETTRKMIIVGLCCTQENPADRPSMIKATGMLEGSLDSLQTPPKPTVSSSTGSSSLEFPSTPFAIYICYK